MPLALPAAPRFVVNLSAYALILLVAACGQAPQGGFHGFPPPSPRWSCSRERCP
jgi:hypothetical protein